MEIVNKQISREKLKKMASAGFGNMVKAVVDLEVKTMAVDAPMHSDLETQLLSSGSKQENLWGINLYPDKTGEDFIEYDSMINVRPQQNNFSRGVEDSKTAEQISSLVKQLTK